MPKRLECDMRKLEAFKRKDDEAYKNIYREGIKASTETQQQMVTKALEYTGIPQRVYAASSSAYTKMGNKKQQNQIHMADAVAVRDLEVIPIDISEEDAIKAYKAKMTRDLASFRKQESDKYQHDPKELEELM